MTTLYRRAPIQRFSHDCPGCGEEAEIAVGFDGSESYWCEHCDCEVDEVDCDEVDNYED